MSQLPERGCLVGCSIARGGREREGAAREGREKKKVHAKATEIGGWNGRASERSSLLIQKLRKERKEDEELKA